MQIQVFSIFDIKAQAYMQPFFMNSTGMATRAFAEPVNDPEHLFCKNAEDFSLYRIGVFNDSNGTFESGTPEFICQALSLKKLVSLTPKPAKPESELGLDASRGTEEEHGQVLPVPAFLRQQSE